MNIAVQAMKQQVTEAFHLHNLTLHEAYLEQLVKYYENRLAEKEVKV